jgi:hypothetical protein
MLNQIMKYMRDTHPWVLSPGCLLDRFLDYLDTLNAFVLPAGAANPSYRYVTIDARRYVTIDARRGRPP